MGVESERENQDSFVVQYVSSPNAPRTSGAKKDDQVHARHDITESRRNQEEGGGAGPTS